MSLGRFDGGRFESSRLQTRRFREKRSKDAITAIIEPALSQGSDADTPAHLLTSGTYQSTQGAIQTVATEYIINGILSTENADLIAGDTLQISQNVVDTAGNSQSFFTANLTIIPSVALSQAGLPSISGTPEVGQELTCSEGIWAGSAARTYSFQWTRDGVDIAGATANTYTLVAADAEAMIACLVVADDGFSASSVTAAPVSVTYAAPVAAGNLPDQNYTEQSGDRTVDASVDFTGAVGGTWSVTGAGATCDQAGIVTIPTDTLHDGTFVTVTYTNSGGSAQCAFLVSVADATAPVLSNALDAADGINAATGSVDTDEGNGTLFWVVTRSATKPGARQIKAGQDHTRSPADSAGSQTVSAAGTQVLTPAPSGLTGGTGYFIHIVQQDATGNQSAVISSDGFTTDTAAGGPGITSVLAEATGDTTARISISAQPVGAEVHWYVSTSATPPSATDLKAGTGAASSGNYTISEVAQLTPGPLGLSPSTTYFAHAIVSDGGQDSAIVSDSFTTEATDVIAPTLSSPTATVLDTTTADLRVTTDEDRGALHWYVSTSATAPSAADLKAGIGAAAAGYVNVSATESTITLRATGLTEVAHYGHFLHVDPSGNESAIVSTAGFNPADVTAPILSSMEAWLTPPTAFAGTVNTDNAEGSLNVVLTTSGTAPTAAQIRAGQDHTGAPAALHVQDQPVTSAGPNAFTGSGLQGETEFWAHATHTDLAGNEATPITSSASFTTGVAALDPSTLYGPVEQGAWYAPSPATCYQDPTATIPAAVGDPVGYIADLSGNGNHATQLDALKKPILRQTAGGAYYLEPDGVDDCLETPVGALDHATFSTVAGFEANGNNERLIDNRGSGSGFHGWFVKSRNSFEMFFVEDSAGQRLTYRKSTSAGATYVSSCDFSAGDGNYWVNRSAVARYSDTGASRTITRSATGMILGDINGAQMFSGKFFGCVVIDRVLTTTEREGCETYVAGLSGVTL